MLYVVLGVIPATSNVILSGGWQIAQFVAEPDPPGDCARNQTRMELPAAHEGALNKATKGLAVGRTTGKPPLTSELT